MSVKKVTQIAIVDDFQFIRESIGLILANAPEFQVSAECADGIQATELAHKGFQGIMILEPLVPKREGIDLTKQLVTLNKSLKILVFTADNAHHNAIRMLRAGAAGWVPKTAGGADLLKALRTVNDGKVFLTEELQRVFAERYVRPDSPLHPSDKLSDREFQVMRQLALGRSNREIAELLFIGVKTVDTHRANLLRKLNLRNNSDVTRFAIQHGFIKY